MDKLQAKTIFTLFLLSSVLILFFLTLELGRVARLVPLKVVIPTLLFLMVQLALERLPGLARIFNHYGKIRFPESEHLRKKTKIASTMSGQMASVDNGRLQKFAWILLLPVFICFFGFLTAVPMFMLFYLRWRSKESWLFSIVMTAVMGCVLYWVFSVGLHIRFYEGLLWHWLGL